MRRVVLIGCCLLFVMLSGAYLPSIIDAEEPKVYDAEEIYASASSSVIYIRNIGEYGTTHSVGSGVIIAPEGTAVTAYHVVKDAFRLEAVLPDGRVLGGVEVAAYAEPDDVALLRLPPGASYAALPLRSEAMRHGEQVFAIGYPLKETAIITEGIVNAPSAEINGRSRILTSAQIVSGMSGGPLIDRQGRVAGVISGSLRTMPGIHLIVSMEEVEALLHPGAK